jgi:hypothetical protein
MVAEVAPSTSPGIACPAPTVRLETYLMTTSNTVIPCRTCGAPAWIGEKDGTVTCAACHVGADHLGNRPGHVNGGAQRRAMGKA